LGGNRRNDWDLDPFSQFGVGDVLGDFNREFRRMNRELIRLERDFTRSGGQAQLPSLVDRNIPVLPNIVMDQSGQRQAQFQFDTRGFQPEDISIKTEDGNRLIVTAKHEDKSEDHHHYREFKRLIKLPEGVDLEQMKSRLSPQGVLTIQAAYQPPAIEQGQSGDRMLEIKHEGSKQGQQQQKQGQHGQHQQGQQQAIHQK